MERLELVYYCVLNVFTDFDFIVLEKPGTKLIWVSRPPSFLDSIIWPKKRWMSYGRGPGSIIGLVASSALSCPISLQWSPAQPSLDH